MTRHRWLLVGALMVTLAVVLTACQISTNPHAWQALGPTDGSAILSLATDPHTPELVYAGSSDGVVYRTLANKGTATQPSAGIPATAPVAALVADTRTAGTLYAGTRSGLYISTDYGDTWKARNSSVFPTDDGIDTLIAGADATTLIAGSVAHGIAISHDAGMTWQPANSGLPNGAEINALLRDPASNALYVAVAHAGIFASTDGGHSWVPRASGLPTTVEVLALALLPTHGLMPAGPTLYAGTSGGLYASGDGGQQWSAVAASAVTGHVAALATDAAHPGWIYAGTQTAVLRSEDGGVHWSDIASGISQQVIALTVVSTGNAAPVVFAASGQLTRFPPFTGGSQGPGNTVVSWILLGLLVAFALVFLYRSRGRTRRTYGQRSAARPRASVQSRDEAPPTAPLNGHKPLDTSQRATQGGRHPQPGSGDGRSNGGESEK